MLIAEVSDLPGASFLLLVLGEPLGVLRKKWLFTLSCQYAQQDSHRKDP